MKAFLEIIEGENFIVMIDPSYLQVPGQLWTQLDKNKGTRSLIVISKSISF